MVVSLISGMRSVAWSGRLQSISNRDSPDSTSGAFKPVLSRRATSTAPGSQAICAFSASASKPRLLKLSGIKFEACSQTNSQGLLPSPFTTITGAHEAVRSSRSSVILFVPRAVTYVTFFQIMRYCGLFDTAYDNLSNTISPKFEKGRLEWKQRADECHSR